MAVFRDKDALKKNLNLFWKKAEGFLNFGKTAEQPDPELEEEQKIYVEEKQIAEEPIAEELIVETPIAGEPIVETPAAKTPVDQQEQIQTETEVKVQVTEEAQKEVKEEKNPEQEKPEKAVSVEKENLPIENQKEGAKAPEKVPEAPYGPKIASITRKGIEYYWKKPEVAEGYCVYRAYHEDGPFEQIALIERRNVGTYIDGNFDHNRLEVYYTVCSFITDEEGNRIHSEMLKPTVAKYRTALIPERTATYIYSGMTRNIRVFHGWGEPEHVQWVSENEAVATVDAEGKITAVSAGKCTIRCTDLDSGTVAETCVVVDREADEPLNSAEPRYTYNSDTGFWENGSSAADGDAVIMMVGDMMCGKRQMEVQYSEKEGWNFNSSYAYIREVTAKSDLAVGNLETLLASGWPYMLDETYINNTNNCNATPRYLDAIRYGGFDAVVMANNHNCDGGPRALLQTIEQVDKYRFPRTGVFASADEKRFFIANVKGIKVGFVSYNSKDTGFNGKDGSWSKKEKNVMLNIFDAKKAEQDIRACREAGAEYVIAYMHWGFKNFRQVAKHQFEEAQIVANAGADYIVGSNPHVVQMYDEITAADGRKVPCAYSVGNFQAVMNQIKGNRDSVIMRIVLKKDENGKVMLADNRYIPCFTYTDCGGHPWAPVALCESMHKSVFRKGRKTIQARIVEAMGSKIKKFV